jgi:glycine hydroxymethyltransferase
MTANYDRCVQRVSSVLSAVEEHQGDKNLTLSLVPTENQMSYAARSVLSSDLVHRYLLLDTTVWEYPQLEQLKKIEDLCKTHLGALYHVDYVNIRPLSGINALLVVLASMSDISQTVYTVSPNEGGHGATEVIARRLGLNVQYVPFDATTLDFDFDQVQAKFKKCPPNIIYLDFSNILFPVSLRRLAELSPEGTLVYFDCSQILGLMADPDFFNPLAQGTIVTGGSTHKSFPGPQKGIYLSNDPAVMKRIQRVSDAFISNNHMNSVAALAISAAEMIAFGREYSRAVRVNAKTLASHLAQRDIPVLGRRCGEFTETHQIWVAPPAENDTSDVVARLMNAGIIVNSARMPPLGGRRGIRLGTTEATRLGMGQSEMAVIADLFADAYHQRLEVSRISDKVRELKSSFQHPRYCVDDRFGFRDAGKASA